jgi:2-dehydro-3-deoxyphosphogluconate aldolase/(4S)-4-hydroxy-2-oxoglutarate aldolase
MPTGGVNASRESVREWIKAGAAFLGMGSKLVRKDLVGSYDCATIQKIVRKVLDWIQEAWEK